MVRGEFARLRSIFRKFHPNNARWNPILSVHFSFLQPVRARGHSSIHLGLVFHLVFDSDLDSDNGPHALVR